MLLKKSILLISDSDDERENTYPFLKESKIKLSSNNMKGLWR